MRRQVMIRQGCVDGFSDADPVITVFRGIPYAKPPVDELRWREPQPAEAWDGVLEAGDFAPMPMQPLPGSNEFYGREWQIDADTPMAEDCLYLNIWTPALRGCGSGSEIRTDSRCDGHGLPVMVWLYGGAFQTGSTCEKEFNGEQLARQGVVVVSIAYRLNVFGFFAHAMLEKEAVDGRPCANFGFLDQRMGIQWVKDNIALFGGNPANITVFGQSAGAASALAQSVSPMNDGLFQRVIMQSGGGTGLFNRHLWSLEDAQRNGARFLKYLEVESIAEARSVPATDLLEAAVTFPACDWSGQGDDVVWAPMTNWIPCVDGTFLVEQYRDALIAGHRVPCDLLVGNTTGEFMVPGPDGTPYPEGECGNLDMIDAWVSGGGSEPYRYRFDVDMPGDDAGAFHSSDLWFSFGTLPASWRPFRGWHYDLSHAMNRYWVNFAATGDPNGSGLPEWTACGPDGQRYMLFGGCHDTPGNVSCVMVK